LQQQTLLRFRCWKFSALLQNLNARIRVWSCCRNLCLFVCFGEFLFLGLLPMLGCRRCCVHVICRTRFSGRKKSAREKEIRVGGGEK
jgi:hypothetical protein